MMNDYISQLDSIVTSRISGSIVRTEGLTAAAAGFPAPLGSLALIERQAGAPVEAEVIGFRDNLTLLFPLGDVIGIRQGNRVTLARSTRSVRVGNQLLGRVIDARGRVIDNKPAPVLADRVPLDRKPPAATSRPRIDTTFSTGVRAIDGLLTCGVGQRIGVFAGSGVGKSVTLGMMAKYSSADVIVIGLIGERGREVNEFLERDLGPTGLARSVCVVATSDEPAIMRVQAASTATAVAEYFRDQGKNVLLMMDSLTRFALAQREIGLAAGEPPTTRGYPPSVFALLPRLVERAGRTPQGSITAIYSVLVEGDDVNEPVSDTVRGLLDGHVILSRKLAAQSHYPAIEVLGSISRLFTEITTPQQRSAAAIVRELLSAYREHEDLISIGAYRTGANPTVDTAIAMRGEILQFLKQSIDEKTDVAKASEELLKLAMRCQQPRKAAVAQAPVMQQPPRRN
ncbi:ATPase, FliI/YscN family [Pirellula staleyi DSM 6068]|uniref:ATPase, FliI/YscN family n=1 Tax=Pirellula staleyi (strain ATCC 27377 / DSM 6068 / ICPB 4128) TaxID=530564 RepID=D2R528_PIRSD|nr:FliI/YscN family ATPase [Pirellula staleyi]ADB18990.1 ATPase, FliI/YscN family [Pirellula staleyi DSM 6068]